MRRDAITILVILLISAVAATAANTSWHGLDWIRRPPAVVHRDPLPNGIPQEGIPQEVDDETMMHEERGPTAELVLEYLHNETACFVDAREHHEFIDGHLRGAFHLPSSAVYDRMDDVISMLPVDGKVIVYCGGGGCEASDTVRDVLIEYGYADVEIYDNGWEGVMATDTFDEFIVTGTGDED